MTSPASTASENNSVVAAEPDNRWCVRRHLRVGWWSLALFVVLGAVLETLHGFKAGMYLDVSNETRRLLWTLAHAHGTLLALVNVAFAMTVSWLPRWSNGSLRIASGSLLASTALLPAGFFLGGVYIHDGDPGVSITLVPPGAFLLLVGVILTARAATKSHEA